jgi:hypothetical protein
MQIALYPVNVPTSSASFAPISRTRNSISAPWSGETCIAAPGNSAVSARTRSSTASVRAP